MIKPKINIGLDMGIASVGWSIVDENRKIIKHGVRRFPTTDDPMDSKLANEKKREMRSFRRQTRRRQTRKRDFILFLLENKFIDLDFDLKSNKRGRPQIKNQELLKTFDEKYKDIFSKFKIHQLREKGLEKNLSFDETLFTLYWYLTRRGFGYKVSEKELDKIEKQFEKDKILLKELPIKIENKIFEKYGYINGEFRRLFSRKKWLEEINIFLDQQNIKEKIKDKFLRLFNRQRSYELGPGMEGIETKPTKWGRFNRDTGEYDDNMWDKTIGKCSFFTSENRAPKSLLTSQIFNLLNDLNNMSVMEGKEKIHLDKKQKLDIINIATETKSFINKMNKYFISNNMPELEMWNGLRIDKNNKKIITTLDSLHEFNKEFKGISKTINFNSIFNGDKYVISNPVNYWISACSRTKDTNKRFKTFKAELKELNINTSVNNYEIFLETIAVKSKAFSSNHSLSEKAMAFMIPILIEENKNQMQIIHESRKNDKENKRLRTKYIDKSWINNEILAPTVKRSVRQTINIINRIIKLYGKDYDIDNIVIEMAREHNNKQAKENLISLQKAMELRNKDAENIIKEAIKGGIDPKGNAIAKIILWKEQNGYDAYTGKVLDLSKVIQEPTYTDIDHIIPYSISFDNSMKNKVLTSSLQNSKKGKNTPYLYLSDVEFNTMRNKWNDWYINIDSKFKNYKKYNNLTDINDYVSNPELAFGFIARNLVDTRYSSKAVLNKLQEHFFETSTKIKVINGRMTSFLRRYIDTKNKPLLRPITKDGVNLKTKETWDDKKYIKNRVWHGHHAEDATIAVVGSMIDPKVMKMIEKNLSNPFDDKFYEKFTPQEKGEAILNTYKDKQALWLGELRDELNIKMDTMQFSYMLSKPKTTQLFNETLYGFKKFKNKDKNELKKKTPLKLIELKKSDAAKLFIENYEKSNLSIADKKFGDLKLYNELKEIYLNNREASFPFKEAADENGNIILSNYKVPRRISKINKLASFNSDTVIWVNNNSGFYQNMEWVAVDIYLDDNDKKRIIPVNAINHTFVNGEEPIPKKDIIIKQLKHFKITKNIERIRRLYKGNILLFNNNDKKETFIFTGCTLPNNTIELKNLCYENPKRQIFSINSSELNDAKILNLDYLGNTYKKALL